MFVKRMFKFILPGVLLAAGITAFAVDEATVMKLKDGTAATWSQFVTALNNPSALEVNVDNDAKVMAANKLVTDAQDTVEEKERARDNAKEAYESTAEGSVQAKLTAAQNALNSTAEGSVKANLSEAEEGLKTAKADSVSAQGALKTYIDGLETAYNNLVTKASLKNDTIASLKTEQSNLLPDQSAAQGNLNQATINYNNLTSQLNALPKKTKSETVGWMSDYFAAADAFKTGYNKSKDEPEIWYTYASYRSGISLYVSFDSAQPTYVPDDNEIAWTKISPNGFYDNIVAPKTGDFKDGEIASVDICFGKSYADLNNGLYTYNVTTIDADTKRTLIVTRMVAAVQTISEQNKYQVTTTLNEVQTAYKTDSITISNNIALAQKDVDKYNRELNGFHPGSTGWTEGSTEIDGINEQLASLKTKINNLQGEVDTLNGTTIPAAKTKWENAQKDTLTGDAEYSKLQGDITTAKNNITTAQGKVETAQKAVDAAEQAVADAQKDVDDAKQAYDDAVAAVTAAEADVTTQQTNLASVKAEVAKTAQDAFVSNCQDVTLSQDVVATAPITLTTFTGTIDGNGKIINIELPEGSSQTSLFRTFRGTLSNAAINGSFATSTNGSYIDNVAVNAGNAWRYYDDNSNKAVAAASLAELGFLARDRFGVDFDSKELVALNDDSKVYNVTVYSSPTSQAQSYVQVSSNGFVGENGAVTVPVNMFAKSATSDIKSRSGLTNVYYQDGDNLVCQNVEIVEKNNFYCPENITAVNLTYNREFKNKMNALCVPFEMSYDYSDKITQLCTYDRETTEKFWFTVVDESDVIPANTPILMYAELESGESFTLDLTNVDLKQTPANQIVRYEDSQANSGTSYGTFKSVASGQFGGQFNASRIYGLNGGKFQLAGEGSSFPAFRMAIASSLTPTNAPQLAPRYIALQDEDGNVITEKYEENTTGINGVESDMIAVNVAPGIGEIIFTSDADFGQVEVYSLEGRVAARTYVSAGTTRVSVQRGLYIVLGQKVLVK